MVAKRICNKKCGISILFILSAAIIYILNKSLGHYLITEAYFERSFALLNNIIEGRNEYQLAFYYSLADDIVFKLIIGLLLLSTLPYLLPQLAAFYNYRIGFNKNCFAVPLSPAQTAGAGVCVFFLTSLPLCFVSFPPLIDYPFHLARVFILDNWSQSEALQDWYDIQSFILPNMGMDILCLLLAKAMPIELAGRLLIAIIFGIILGGGIFLNRCLYGHSTLWPLFLSVFLFNWIFLLGFLSYLLGVGLLLWATGGWIIVYRRGLVLRMAYGSAVTSLLFFCHLSGLGLYAVIIAGYELQRCLTNARKKLLTSIGDLFIGASTFIAPLVLFFLSSTSGEIHKSIAYQKPLLWTKLSIIFNTLMFGIRPADVSTIAIFLFMIMILIRWGNLRFSKKTYLSILFLVATYFLLPYRLLGNSFVDSRLPIAIIFILVSFSQLELKSKRWHYTATIVLTAFLLFRCVIFSYNWSKYAETIDDFTNAYKKMPPRSILFVASEQSPPDFFTNKIQQPPIWHLASLATVKQMIFVPAIWAFPSQHPIVVSRKYEDIKQFQRSDPIIISESNTLRALVEQIQQVVTHEKFQKSQVYLLVLDPKINYASAPGMFEIVESRLRYILLSIKDRTDTLTYPK